VADKLFSSPSAFLAIKGNLKKKEQKLSGLEHVPCPDFEHGSVYARRGYFILLFPKRDACSPTFANH